jgi:3-oxoacyl-[acyl-carrier protein] reductase
MKYTDRVAFVTGARKGVGRMVADYLLSEGATVIGMSRGEGSIDHASYYHCVGDIGDPPVVRETFRYVREEHGRLDILVHCAAVATSTYAFLVPVAAAEEMVRTNILGTLYVAREAAKIMRRVKYGRIITIGSIHARIAPVGASIYAATKAAQETLGQVLAKEFAGDGITVNTLALSPIETDMLRGSGTPEIIQKVIDGLAIPRLAEPEDVFAGIDFFASETTGFYTGQTLYLGGVHG